MHAGPKVTEVRSRGSLSLTVNTVSSEELLSAAFDAAPVAMVVIDDQDKVLHANQAAAELFEAHDKTLADASFSQQIAALPGIELTVMALANPGATQGRGNQIAVLRDTAALQARTTNIIVDRKMEALGELAGNIAHEFNNHLSGASGFAQLALARPDDTERVQYCLDEILASTEAGARLTSRIMVFGREHDRVEEATTLAPHILDAASLIEPLLDSSITLTFDVAGDEVGRALVSPGELTEMLLNLADNSAHALRSTAAGEIAIGLERRELSSSQAAVLADATPGSYLAVSVEDNGSGMSPEIRERMFDPFFSTEDVGKGEGLGLALVYTVVARAGGRVDVCTAAGVGTKVTLFFPLAE
jgi:signal transduction histidine kinase